MFSRPSEFVLPRKLGKTGLHENASPFSAFLELRNSPNTVSQTSAACLCVTAGIHRSSAGGYQTALHCCGHPFWIGGELPVFVVRHHAPNRDAVPWRFDMNTCTVPPQIYRVLAWNSSWRSPIGLTQSNLMTSLSHGTAYWFSPVSVANELIAQYSNTWLMFAVAVWQRTSETLHLPQLHLCRSATGWFMYAIWGYSYVLYVQQQYFLHACSSMLWMYWQKQVSVLALPQQQQHSRSIPPRPNTLTLSCTLPCQSLRELSWQKYS